MVNPFVIDRKMEAQQKLADKYVQDNLRKAMARLYLKLHYGI